MSAFVINRKVRLRIGFLFGIAYLVFARPTPGSLLLGLPVALAGLVVRAWAAGHIVKNEQLTMSGPYAHTRNPLYFGSFLIAAGFALAAHWSLLLVVIALFAFIYGPTIEQERTSVSARFPEDYARYEASVPPFVPRLTPWRGQTGGESFSFSLYMRQREWQAGLAFLAASAWLIARSTLGF
ncbi:MAG TPA: methyltransferase [Gemmatimonadaceae bacterium]